MQVDAHHDAAAKPAPSVCFNLNLHGTLNVPSWPIAGARSSLQSGQSPAPAYIRQPRDFVRHFSETESVVQRPFRYAMAARSVMRRAGSIEAQGTARRGDVNPPVAAGRTASR